MSPSHVLVPLDGSPLSDAALTYALRVFDCPVTVLNVVTPLDSGMSEGGLLDAGEERKVAAEERASELIDRATERAATEGRRIETAVESGDPTDVILGYTEDNDVDGIVMGGHGGDPTTLVRRLLGTVATTVVAEAPVTVTVVRDPPSGADH